MRRGDKIAIIWAIVVVVLTFVSAGFTVGLEFAMSNATYFIFQNIVAFSYGLIGVSIVVALFKHLSYPSIALIISSFVLSVGKLYFLEFKVYNRLLSILFVLSVVYTIYYWVAYALRMKKYQPDNNLKHINGILPVIYIGFSLLIVSIRLMSYIETEISVPMGFIGVSLLLSVVAVIVGAVLIKERSPTKEYVGKLCAIFFATIFATLLIPLLTIEYTNSVFDTSIGERNECLVVDKYTTHNHKSGRGYHIVLMVDGERINFPTDKIVYTKYDVGDRMPLYQHDGAYGMTYYEYRLDSIYKYE